MESAATVKDIKNRGPMAWLKSNRGLILLFLIMLVLPFIIALVDGQSITDVLQNETGNAKFVQGLLIEIFILAIFAISYDLLLGITGLLSFGHAMFFAAGAYFTGIAFKTLGWGLLPTIAGVVIVGIFNALLFAVVLPRVKGITFALVTLGIASVFFIVVQSNELSEYTGADVGLQGVIVPEFLNTNSERFRLYVIVLIVTFLVYLFYRLFVDSPTGRVCIANRENEGRALMIGYNTFYFKLVALIISSITAAIAGFFQTIHAPIVSPTIAGLGWTVAGLLMVLIGGWGTLSGAMIGAAVFRLLTFFLDRWFGENANFLLGAIYILLVLFVPFGIVGTWRARSFQIEQGRQRLIELVTGKDTSTEKNKKDRSN
ncbi:MAG: branched-chain amino acid ABC transporter permease [Candidatus Promineifilaceae bacterium]|nr:branched-chain amino acid ABC transporter permease [Candidatus Promineifilaceae bacterium]